MARDEVGAIDQVRRADRAGAEAEVRDRDRARLLRVVDEVGLRVPAGVLADDRDRVLVRSDGPVGAEAVEDRAHDVVRLGRERPVDGEREVGDVVDDPHRESAPWLRLGEVVEDGLGHRGRELLRREAVPPPGDERHRAFPLGERREHVLEERLAERSRLLAAVEDGHALRRGGKRCDERVSSERPIQADRERRRPSLRLRRARRRSRRRRCCRIPSGRSRAPRRARPRSRRAGSGAPSAPRAHPSVVARSPGRAS